MAGAGPLGQALGPYWGRVWGRPASKYGGLPSSVGRRDGLPEPLPRSSSVSPSQAMSSPSWARRTSRAGAAGGWTAGSLASIPPTTWRPSSCRLPPHSPHPPFLPTLVTSPCHRVPDIFYDQAFIFLKVKTEQNKKYEETEHLQDCQEAGLVGLGAAPGRWGSPGLAQQRHHNVHASGPTRGS